MHYAQTIIDAAVSALDGLATLTGGVTSKRFFPEPATASARVRMAGEELPEAFRIASQETRSMLLQVDIYVASSDVQRDLNEIRGEVEAALPAALEAVADCAYMTGIAAPEIEVDQDRETLVATLDYTVEYATAVGDPTTRV